MVLFPVVLHPGVFNFQKSYVQGCYIQGHYIRLTSRGITSRGLTTKGLNSSAEVLHPGVSHSEFLVPGGLTKKALTFWRPILSHLISRRILSRGLTSGNREL